MSASEEAAQSEPHKLTAFGSSNSMIEWHGARGPVARARAYTRSRAMAVVALSGEIDECTAESAGLYVRGLVSAARPMVADLTDVTFLGTAGIRQLFLLNQECMEAGAIWALVANRRVSRLLRVLDRDNVLPLAASLGEALQSLATRAPSTGSLQRTGKRENDCSVWQCRLIR